jgi:hypothetical protein
MKFFTFLRFISKYSYRDTILEITNVAKTINIQKSGSDGRVESLLKEGPFLVELKETLLKNTLCG